MLVKDISEEDRKKLTFLGLVGIAFLGVFLYSSILHAPFVLDDYSSIVDNEIVKNLRTAFYDVSKNRYAVDLSFALNYAAGRTKPLGYHLVNNMLHAANALLVYWLVILIFRTPAMSRARPSGKFIAFASAFIFVSHPIQTQAVTYIAQRYTSAATFFYLLSLVMYLKSRLINREIPEGESRGKHAASLALYGVSLISAFLAMKSKEIAFTLPFIIMLCEFSFLRERRNVNIHGQNLKRWLYLFPVLLTLLIIPLSMMDFSRPAETVLEQIDAPSRETLTISRADYLLTEFRVIVTYLRLLIFPLNQSIDYTYSGYNSLFQREIFLSFVLLVMLFSLGIYLMYRSRSSSPGLRIIAFGIFWFFITLSVESTIIPIKDVIFEHRLYLPSAGFFVAAAASLEHIIREQKFKAAIVLLLVLILSVTTYTRNGIWQDPQLLWEDVLVKFPNNVRAYNALGVISKNDSDHEKATEYFQKILTINATYPPAYYNLGDIRLKLGDYAGAIDYFNKALTLTLTYHFQLDTLISLAIAYSESGDDQKAVATFIEAISRYPDVLSPYNNLGRQYIKMGEADLAIETLQKALKIRESSHIYYNLSQAYALKGETLKSRGAHQRAMELKENGR